MKVHVVCRDQHKTRILPRLANQLAGSARWSMGDAPDPHADVNYYFPYLEWTGAAGLSAAWFTHRDTYHSDGKAALWDRAAAAVDLRLTSARGNLPDLARYGPAGLVTPALDRDKFQPARNRPARTGPPVVGTGGYVYRGGRKGEELVAALAQRGDYEVVASGKGWPVPCQEYSWQTLHEFYQALDVYVCTSLLEGIPMGPLEALACGVPVVVPRGVGLLDDFPDVPGVARYDAGDLAGLLAGLEQALGADADPASLRALTEPYTAAAWREDHERALENLLWPPREPETLPALSLQNVGIYCVAFGDPSKRMARKLIASVKECMPRTEVCVASDEPLDAGEDLWLEHEDVDIGGRTAKLRMYDLAPARWQYVLYLDADTEVVADVCALFQFLADGWEFVVCKNPGKYHELGMMTRPDNLDESKATFDALGGRDWLQLNGGVMAFRRCERTRRFFSLWQQEWQRWGKRDQAALHRALWRQPLRTYVLGNEWNTITRYDDASITAGILHYPTTARRWSGRVEGRLDSAEAWQRVTA